MSSQTPAQRARRIEQKLTAARNHIVKAQQILQGAAELIGNEQDPFTAKYEAEKVLEFRAALRVLDVPIIMQRNAWDGYALARAGEKW